MSGWKRDVLWVVVGALLGLFLSVFVQPLLEDLKKRVVIYIWPKPFTYSSTSVSGCSGGELSKLLVRARLEGLSIQAQSRVAITLLCQDWTDTDSPRKILQDMAAKFPNCFEIDKTDEPPVFSVRYDSGSVCKTSYMVDPSTNQIVDKGAGTFLCVNSLGSGNGPRECSEEELKITGFKK